jgi:hypothetical protein
MNVCFCHESYVILSGGYANWPLPAVMAPDPPRPICDPYRGKTALLQSTT